MNYEALQSQHDTLHIKEMCLADVNGLKGFYCDGNIAIKFLIGALCTYKEKYGVYAKIDRYAVYFEPLGVLEICD